MKNFPEQIKKLNQIEDEIFSNKEKENKEKTENIKQKTFDLLGLEEKDLFLDPENTRDFFGIYGIDDVKKINNTVNISCYRKDQYGNYLGESNINVILYGGGHTHISNVDEMIGATDYRVLTGFDNNLDKNLADEIRLARINFEVAELMIIVFGFRNLLKRSEFLEDKNNNLKVFIPWKKQAKTEVLGFLQETVANNAKNIEFILGEDEQRNNIFE